MTQPLEILAPAGDEACLDAALRAGADAIYFGLDQGFNARARAANLPLRRLAEIVDKIHDHGRRGYLTLNTLVFDDELEQVERVIEAAAEAGVDAVIVQDLGVARLTKRLVPTLRLHASTQATCTDRASIQLWAELGAERVTLAREMSLREIAVLRSASPIELEIFAHGALCVAYSGQCLTSEAIGGRSANRGACAQACRHPYELVVDGVLHDATDVAYLLSPKDLDASQLVPEILGTGVRAIKIEGRLKSPEYVAATTLLYRRALEVALEQADATDRGDAVPPARGGVERLRQLSAQIFSRGASSGYLRGIDHQALVDGTSCDHIGQFLGTCLGLRTVAGRTYLRLRNALPIQRGDGILIQGERAGQGELGGRIWSLLRGGRDVESAEAAEEVLVWLGPERELPRGLEQRRVFRTSAASSAQALDRLMPARPRGVPITARLVGAIGERPTLTFDTADGRSATVTLEQPIERARQHALDKTAIREKLERLGDTVYTLDQLDVQIPDGTILPLSALNRGRRAAADGLKQAAHRSHAVRHGAGDPAPAWTHKTPPPSGLFVTCRNREQAEAALDAGAQGIYLDVLGLTGVGATLRELRAHSERALGIALPRIRKPGEEKIDAYVLGLEPDMVLVRSFGSLASIGVDRERGECVAPSSDATPPRRTACASSDVVATRQSQFIGDFSLNAVNRAAAFELLGRPLAAFTPGYDLDAAQLVRLLDSPLAAYAEVVIHHPMPLFHMEHCVFAWMLSSGHDHRDCGRPCERHVVSLRDRKGVDLPLEADVGCRNTVFHAVAQSAGPIVPRLTTLGVRRFRLELVRETPQQTAAIVRSHLELIAGSITAAQLTKHLDEMGVSVARGSLRVLPGP